MIFVIRKQTAVYAICILAAVAVFIASVEFAGLQPASAMPASNRVIIIDPGHGGEDGGAVGSDGTVEKDLNLAVAVKLQKLLEMSGCTVFMTRSEDESLSTPEDAAKGERKVADLANRKQITDDLNVEAFVSIHMNTFTDPQYFGTQVFYSSSPTDSKKLADLIQAEVKAYDPENTRVAKDGSKNIFILSDTDIPSVVVECGFLSNEKDLARLKTDEYQQKIATAIFSGINKFYLQKQ